MEYEMSNGLKAYIAELDKEIQQAYNEMPKLTQRYKYSIRYLFVKYFLFPLLYPYLWVRDKRDIKFVKKMIKEDQLLIEINYHKRKSLIENIKFYEKQKEYMLIKWDIKGV